MNIKKFCWYSNLIDFLHEHSEIWLLKTNLMKTKTVIFQTQNRKSTREKSPMPPNTINTTFHSNGNFSILKQRLVEKIFVCNELSDARFLPILLHSSKLHTQVCKYFIWALTGF